MSSDWDYCFFFFFSFCFGFGLNQLRATNIMLRLCVQQFRSMWVCLGPLFFLSFFLNKRSACIHHLLAKKGKGDLEQYKVLYEVDCFLQHKGRLTTQWCRLSALQRPNCFCFLWLENGIWTRLERHMLQRDATDQWGWLPLRGQIGISV